MLLKGDFKIQKSCKYCSRVYDENYRCNKKPVKRKKIDESVKFRNGPKWQKKRKEIKERDNYLCQVCIRKIYNTRRKYNSEGLQVHHALPINLSEDLKLDENNLITLCSMHHSMCDKGQIPYEEVKKIINEQNQKQSNPHHSKNFLERHPNTDSPHKFTPNLINVSFLERKTR